MEFTFDETQQGIRDLAAQIFEGQATVDRVREAEAGDERFDRKLWAELAKADLIGLSVPESAGGSGLGMLELCLVLEQQGKRVAPVPLVWTVVAAQALADDGNHGDLITRVIAGDAVLTLAVQEAFGADLLAPTTLAKQEGDRWMLTGSKPAVPAGHVAERVLVAATADDGAALFLVDPAAEGVSRELAVATDRSRVAHLSFDGTPAIRLQTDLGRTVERLLTGLSAVQLGVCTEAIRVTAEYTSNRHQFGRPLSTNQGVLLRAADAYIDTQAMEVTLWNAAWLQDQGRDASDAVLVAAWWAKDAGQRVVHATQHLHGGMGADIDYPIHRHFLWGKTIEMALGGASETLARLGKRLAEATR